MKSDWAAELRQIVEKVLKWVKDVVPTAFGVGLLVYNNMKAKLVKEQLKTEQMELEKEQVNNELIVEKRNAGKSSSDIVNDAIREGRAIKRSEETSSDGSQGGGS